MNDLYLYIDESGVENPLNKQSDLYVLCGCAILDKHRLSVKTRADQIKFKYWGHTDIVFHSIDIAKDDGVFNIFKHNPELKKEFFQDMLKWLQEIPISTFAVIIDKPIARTRGWNRIKVIRESAHHLIKNFILLSLANSNVKGKIIIESANYDKDRYYLQAFTYFLANGIRKLNVTNNETKEALTSVSFVTKRNHDIEEQVADLLAYGAKCKYVKDHDKNYKFGDYELKIVKIFTNKLFKTPVNARKNKMRYLGNIESFIILPKKHNKVKKRD